MVSTRFCKGEPFSVILFHSPYIPRVSDRQHTNDDAECGAGPDEPSTFKHSLRTRALDR